jgi:hypothetical protein
MRQTWPQVKIIFRAIQVIVAGTGGGGVEPGRKRTQFLIGTVPAFFWCFFDVPSPELCVKPLA